MNTRELSEDIRYIGDTLGDVLRIQGGNTLFDAVETMRRAAKTARDAENIEQADAARKRLIDQMNTLDPATALAVNRAFTLYFQLVNIAEDIQRTRVLTQRLADQKGTPVSESFDAVLQELTAHGLSQQEAAQIIADLQLRFVFTAHPTEARRRTTERLLAKARQALEIRSKRVVTPIDRSTADRRLRATIEALWQHASERHSRPEVIDEVKAGLWYLRNVLLDVAPRVQRRLADAMAQHFGNADPLALPAIIGFGSWMGGDRDGNPFVNEAVTERTLELHRWIILDRYTSDLDQLADPLAVTDERLSSSPALEDALRRAGAAVPEVVMEAERRNPHEPLRRMLSLMRERIARTRSLSAGAYAKPSDFLADLQVIRQALINSKAEALANDALLDLMLRVRTFGFHLASLDVREDSRVHRQVIAELLACPDYLDCDDDTRLQHLATLRLPEHTVNLSAEARRLLDAFDSLHRMQARFGEQAVHTYIISMTESHVDVLEVLKLAKLHHIDTHLDIVPLFETREALISASHITSKLLKHSDYRTHLSKRGEIQELLVGYSDSMKEAGILTSRLGVIDAQRAATQVCQREGIKLRVFHGRGGSVSRGGGPTYRAIRALPPEVFSGDMKITEQGEVRSFHFANPELAARYLEQTLCAALATRYHARHPERVSVHENQALYEQLATHGLKAYRQLVEHPHLITYFQEATPLQAIAKLHIASRPSRRKQGTLGLKDLRAIPWVFAWSQSRHVITGWYGVGSALEALGQDSQGLQNLRELYQGNPFFRDLLDNVQMTLAKTDLHIAARYALLCKENQVREDIFSAIQQEFERTCTWVLRVTELDHLLDDDPVVQRSIRLRNPYVDPMSYIQVHALGSARSADDEINAHDWERVARVAIQGIAAGLRNTG